MQSIFKFIFALCFVALAVAYPRGAAKVSHDNEAESALRHERQAGGGHHEVVDFGAHTGHKGAFGWYADFPVKTHH